MDIVLSEQKLVGLRISAADRLCGLRYDRGRTVAPAELGAVNPHAVQNHDEATGDREDGHRHATPLG